MTSALVRPLVEDDLDQVTGIEAASTSNPWSRQLFADELTLPPTSRHWLVAAAPPSPGTRPAVIGFGGVMLVADEAHIMNVAVNPVHRRRGIARRLVARLLLDAGDRGAVSATLEVRASNTAAIALYQRFDMAEHGRRPRYYGDGEDAIIMWVHRIHRPAYRDLLHELGDVPPEDRR